MVSTRYDYSLNSHVTAAFKELTKREVVTYMVIPIDQLEAKLLQPRDAATSGYRTLHSYVLVHMDYYGYRPNTTVNHTYTVTQCNAKTDTTPVAEKYSVLGTAKPTVIRQKIIIYDRMVLNSSGPVDVLQYYVLCTQYGQRTIDARYKLKHSNGLTKIGYK